MGKEYTIAHISDIHVGENGFREDKFLDCIREVNDLSPDLTVITGDLTYLGLPNEFERAKELIDRLDKRPLVVMGNHDARNVGYNFFEEYFGERMVSYEDDVIFLLGVDSTQPDVDEGHIGREFRSYIHKTLFNAPKDKIRIFMLHHHLVPVPMAGRERDILVDAGEILKILTEDGVDLVFCGHRHIPWVWRIEDMHIIHSGTVGSPRTRGLRDQSYVIARISDDKLSVSLKLIGQPERKLRVATLSKRH